MHNVQLTMRNEILRQAQDDNTCHSQLSTLNSQLKKALTINAHPALPVERECLRSGYTLFRRAPAARVPRPV